MTPLVVLLHGFTGAPSSWAEVIGALPRDARTIAPALLGHDDAPLAAARTWDDEIDRVAEIVRRERGPVHLVGYSMGGRVALGLLLRHPGIAARATLIGASPGIDDERDRDARRRDDEARARLIETEGVEAFVRAWEREPIFATQRALPDEVRARHREIRRSHSAAGLAASLRALGQGAMPSLWGSLDRLALPVTLVAGAEDARLRGVAMRMADRLPLARARVVPGAGHDVALERPRELAGIVAAAGETP